MSKYIDKEKVLEYVKTYQAQLALGMIGKDVDSGDLIKAIDVLPTIEVSEDCISTAYLEQEIENQTMTVKKDEEYWRGWNNALGKVVELIEDAPPVIPKPKEVIYGNEHNCIMTMFGECSYSETGCGSCAVVEKVRDALAKTQIKTQNSNENSNEDAISRAEFIEMINGMITDATSHGISPRLDPHFVISMVKSAPSVIPKPKVNVETVVVDNEEPRIPIVVDLEEY